MNRAELRALFSAQDGSSILFSDEADLSAYAVDRSRPSTARCDALALPGSTADVQRLVQYARARGIALVPSGGRTGLAGGAVARDGQIVVSLERMTDILEFDRHLPAVRLEAGLITAHLQQAARDEGFFFPIDFAAAGSSTIGGNLGTNAGGVQVIRYGMLRDWVLGLTVVTGAGQVLKTGGALLKNNAGYDLRHLFVGSEGTLGIITEATLRLAGLPGERRVFLCALNGFSAATELLQQARSSGDTIDVFEVFDRTCLDTVRRHLELPDPCPTIDAGCFVLLELERARNSGTGPAPLPVFLETAMQAGLLLDALEAGSSAGQNRFRAYREQISESLGALHEVHKHDVALPIPALAEFVAWVRTTAKGQLPVAIFGHIGDGNLHLNWIKPEAWTAAEFRQRTQELDSLVYGAIQARGGSISAEHGIGSLKRAHLGLSRTAEEIALMRSIKAILDPAGIMNPGKLLPDPS